MDQRNLPSSFDHVRKLQWSQDDINLKVRNANDSLGLIILYILFLELFIYYLIEIQNNCDNTF